ncbi:sensor histidine kinase [Paenibacillus sp. NPDC058071]|uniref:cache domain-containing sensor histidine kinase n=1 Tax=Paenibacillus sp. NPDC058071 TaxID=3346326 RepID=UPI0036DAD1A7
MNGNQISLHQLEQRFDDYFNRLDQNSVRFFSDSFYASDILNIQLQSTEYYSRTLYNLVNFYSERKETHSATFYNPDEDEVYVVNDTVNASFHGGEEITRMEWYQRLLASPERRTIEPLRLIEKYPERYHLNQQEAIFSLNRIMYDKNKVYGILTANYKTDYLKSALFELVSDEDEMIIMTDKAGAELTSTRLFNPSQQEEDSGLHAAIIEMGTSSGYLHYKSTADKAEQIVIFTISPKWGHILYKKVPVQTVLREVAQTRNTMLGISGILLILLVITTAILSMRFTKPLIQLMRHMVKVGNGEFESELIVKSHDEIGAISATFNQMSRKINYMLNEQYKNEIILKTAQLKMLQSQINPHFFNNTLQAIGGVALEKGVDEIEYMARVLSSMLRYSISATGNDVPLSAEIENIQQYLTIQKFRFEERLNYSLEVDEKYLDIRIPKLILQPLVENAIIHGIEKSIKLGTIMIKVYAEHGCLVIMIADNFEGMHPERLADLQAKLNDAAPNDWINLQNHGILNGFYRLKLRYGDRFRMEIDSDKTKGTTVALHIPIEREDQND